MENVNKWTDGSNIMLNKSEMPIVESTCFSLQGSGSWALDNCNKTKRVLCKRSKFYVNKSVIFNLGQSSNISKSSVPLR